MSLVRCPVCDARLRDTSTCRRCGSDLRLPLEIVERARNLERLAVEQILNGELPLAMATLVEVQRLHDNEFSDRLLGFVQSLLAGAANSPEISTSDAEPLTEKHKFDSVDLSMIDLYG